MGIRDSCHTEGEFRPYIEVDIWTKHYSQHSDDDYNYRNHIIYCTKYCQFNDR